MKKQRPSPSTLTELASILGISKQALNAHRRNADAPAPDDVEAWKIYIAAHGREGTAPPDLKRRMAEKKLSILTTEDASKKTKLKRLEETLIPKNEAQRALTRFVAGLVHRLLPIPLRCSQRFALESDPQKIEAQLNKEIREAVTGADAFKFGLLPCSKCKQQIQI